MCFCQLGYLFFTLILRWDFGKQSTRYGRHNKVSHSAPGRLQFFAGEDNCAQSHTREVCLHFRFGNFFGSNILIRFEIRV